MKTQYGKYTLVSREKLKRAIRKFDTNVSDKDLLVEYDKIGGLIIEEVKGTKKKPEVKLVVQTGSFYDFEEKKGRKKPKVTYK